MIYFAKWKITLIFAVIALGIAFFAPNLIARSDLEDLPGWVPSKQINLGLDLQGGAHIAFEVATDVVVAERLQALEDDVRSELRGAKIGYTGLGARGQELTVRVRDTADLSAAGDLIRDLSAPVNQGMAGISGQRDIDVRTSDDGLIRVTLTEAAIVDLRNKAVSQSIEIIRRRIDELGTLEPAIQREGVNRIIVQVPGEDNPQRIIDLVGRTAKMTFHMHDSSVPIEEAQGGRVPPGSFLVETDESFEPYILLKRRVVVAGDRLTNATASPNPDRPGQWQISFRFDTAGARRFAEATRNNVGRRFAIVLDNQVISAPTIQSAILTGDGRITGDFSIEEANDLAILMTAGALPAPLTPVEQRTVGPDLGADSIAAGRTAALIGFCAVIVFMMLSYGLFGLFANIALITNVVLIAGALSMLQFTLTLPGIAGIVLTIGMAVDANVLIFERIREEMAAGKTPLSAVEAGYQRALGTILDANITTLIAAVILFQLGSGPVRGFSITLAIGILTSVFTAFTFTRLMVATWLRMRRPAALPI